MIEWDCGFWACDSFCEYKNTSYELILHDWKLLFHIGEHGVLFRGVGYC